MPAWFTPVQPDYPSKRPTTLPTIGGFTIELEQAVFVVVLVVFVVFVAAVELVPVVLVEVLPEVQLEFWNVL